MFFMYIFGKIDVWIFSTNGLSKEVFVFMLWALTIRFDDHLNHVDNIRKSVGLLGVNFDNC